MNPFRTRLNHLMSCDRSLVLDTLWDTVKVKGRSVGALWLGHIVSLPLNKFPPSSPEALHTKQAWALSASEGANYILRNLASKSAIFGRTRFFYMPQSWDMGQIILLPLWRKACCGFVRPKKSDGFGRERTCDLGMRPCNCRLWDEPYRGVGVWPSARACWLWGGYWTAEGRSTRLFCRYTQTENRHLEWLVVSECIVQLLCRMRSSNLSFATKRCINTPPSYRG
jgi:hypothetical protein